MVRGNEPELKGFPGHRVCNRPRSAITTPPALWVNAICGGLLIPENSSFYSVVFEQEIQTMVLFSLRRTTYGYRGASAVFE